VLREHARRRALKCRARPAHSELNVRIISGSARGTKLAGLPVDALRPMLDRVKEALFNILREIVPGATVLDLFSGSGSLGLEALSRGARRCLFVEEDSRLARLLERNATKCGLAGRCRVVVGSVLDLPACAAEEPDGAADLVLADPPYTMIDDPNARARFFAWLDNLPGGRARGDVIVTLHHRPMPYALWPTERFVVWDQRVYGQSQLTFFEPGEPTADDRT